MAPRGSQYISVREKVIGKAYCSRIYSSGNKIDDEVHSMWWQHQSYTTNDWTLVQKKWFGELLFWEENCNTPSNSYMTYR
jgi:hypothetical protein